MYAYTPRVSIIKEWEITLMGSLTFIKTRISEKVIPKVYQVKEENV